MIGIELNSESEIACSMCARSVLSARLGSFIFFNESELGSHFSSLSVLLCLIQIEIIGGELKPPPPSPPLPTALICMYLYYTGKVTIFTAISAQNCMVTISTRNTNIHKIWKHRGAIFYVFYNTSPPHFAILLILRSSF